MLDLNVILEAKHRYGWNIVFGGVDKNPQICGAWKDQLEQTDEQLTQLYNRVKARAHNWGPNNKTRLGE